MSVPKTGETWSFACRGYNGLDLISTTISGLFLQEKFNYNLLLVNIVSLQSEYTGIIYYVLDQDLLEKSPLHADTQTADRYIRYINTFIYKHPPLYRSVDSTAKRLICESAITEFM
jgi:hypothetical protein